VDQTIKGAAALVASHVFRAIAILCNQRTVAAGEAIIDLIESCNGNVKAYISEYLSDSLDAAETYTGASDIDAGIRVGGDAGVLFWLLAAEDAQDEGLELLGDAIDDLIAEAKKISGGLRERPDDADTARLYVGSLPGHPAANGFITSLYNESVSEGVIA